MTDSKKTTNDIAPLFGVQAQTIRRWTEAYSDFLSEGANPPKGDTRLFDDDDIGIFALIAEMNRINEPKRNIIAALRAGERGTLPEATKDVAQTDSKYKLLVQIESLREDLEATQKARIEAEALLARSESENQTLKDEIKALTERALRAEIELEKLQKKED